MKKNNKKKLSKKESLELTKTLVLNFNEVEKVAKYEKKTSKKPAFMIAIIGVFAIISGLLYPNIYSLATKDNTKKINNSKKFRKTKSSIITCTKTDTSVENNITSNTIIKLNSKNNLLISYEKDYNETVTSNSLTETPKSIKDLYNYIDPLTKVSITGYDLVNSYKTDQTNPSIINNYTIKLKVDLEKLDKEKLTEQYKTNSFLNVNYNYKDDISKIKNDIESNGYKCD